MTFDWRPPSRTRRTPLFARNIVATSHPLAVQAGLRILAEGGNAVDAAIAAAATLTLTEPVNNSLGSDCFAMIWDGSRLHGLNASGCAPAAWNPNYFNAKHHHAIPMHGWDSVTIPGCVAGWAALHEKFGTLAFEAVLAPAMDYAERGFAVSPLVQQKWARQTSLLQSLPGFAEHFLPHGRAPLVGENFILKGAASTLKRIAQTLGRDFYEGETAHKLVAHAQAYDASITLADLHDYAPEWVTPIELAYRDYTLHQMPPNSQGISLLIAFGILQHFEVASAPIDHPDTQHLLVEVIKLAVAEGYAQIGDRPSPPFSAAQLLAHDVLAAHAQTIDRHHATLRASPLTLPGESVSLTTADRNGMMVSLVQSSYMGFGSGMVVPGTGVSLHNRGYAFTLDPAHPNVVEGGKRPFHTCMPGFLMKDGAPLMSLGMMGDPMQPQGQLQALVRMIDFGQAPQAACDAPRWKWDHGLTLAFEPEIPTAMLQALEARGHLLQLPTETYQDFGAGQFIWRLGDPAVDGYVGASDSRCDGLATGF